MRGRTFFSAFCIVLRYAATGSRRSEIDPVLVPRFARFYSEESRVMWPSARFSSARGHGAL